MTDTTKPPGLERRLGVVSATSLVVANMIGAGIFTTSGLILDQLGDPRALLALWVAGGVVALCGALVYGELGAAFPHAGGEYAFLSRLYHPALGFLTGWVSLFAGFSAPIAASAIGFAEYLARAFPALAPDGGPTWAKRAVAVAVIVAFTALHARGLRLGARVQNALTALKVALVVGLVAAGFASGAGELDHFAAAEPLALDFAGWRTVGLALMWVMFAYSGWNAAAYVGAEIRQPTRNLPRSLLLGTGAVTVLYLLLNGLYVYAVPPAEMRGVIAVGSLTVAKLFSPAFERALSVLIACALFSSLSAFVILGPRVYYAMASDGAFFRFAGVVHPRTRVPAASIVLQGTLAAAMVALGTFDQILTYMGFALGVFPLLAVAGVFRLRRRGTAPYRAPGHPFAAALYLVAGTSILALAYLERPVESSIAVATVLAGLPAYAAFRARGAAR